MPTRPADGNAYAGNTVDPTALQKVIEDAHQLTDEELFKINTLLLFEWLDRRGVPRSRSEEFIWAVFQHMDAVATPPGDAGEPS